MNIPEIAGRKGGVYSETQEHVDQPIYTAIKRDGATPLARAVSACFPEKFLGCYDRYKLRWMKPGPDGKLVPRE